MPRRIALGAACCALAAGCTLGPDYVRPPIDTPAAWRQAAEETESLANVPWWELFEDEVLRELIRVALAENRDLRIAVERIEEARARYGIAKSALWPEVDVRGTAGALRTSEGSLVHTPPEDADTDDTVGLYDLSARVSWELDLFGRVRRANEAELASLLATEEARRAVAITLVSEVARAYLELRDLDRRLEISRRTLGSREEYVVLARDRFEGGITPELDWRQAEAELHRVRAFVAQVEKLVVQKENEISLLLGHRPGAVPRGRAVDEQPIPPRVPAGIPAAILEQRPDVREAEQRLVSANARIGEAKAALFPSISLTGSLGVASTDLGDLLDGDSLSWNVFGSLTQPIFNRGRNRRRVEMRESQQRQAAYDWERTVLQALREVEDSLIALEKTGEQRDAQALRVGAERKVLELSELRYRGGVAVYLEVLDAQRSLFAAEIDEVGTIGEQATSLIRLYRALGGGWPAEATPPVTEAAAATP